MGQYYKAISLDKKQWVSSWDFESGLKLTEHSWIKNPFVNAVEKLLRPGGAWHKTRIVWAGDYADKEKGKNYNLNDLCYSLEYNPSKKEYIQEMKSYAEKKGEKLNIRETSLFDKIKPAKVKFTTGYKFIVNHTKKEFVDKSKVPSVSGWVIHPLSFLTCEGNGRGGGDFGGEDKQGLIGSWARGVISVENKAPKGYKEIFFNLIDERMTD